MQPKGEERVSPSFTNHSLYASLVVCSPIFINDSLYVSPEPGYNRFKSSRGGKGVNLGYAITVEEIFKVGFRVDLAFPFLG